MRMDENTAARLKRNLLRVAYWIGLFLAMLTICLPGLWIVLSSLRPTVEIMAKPPVWIPSELSFDAYVAMFSGIGKGGIPVIDYFRNSLIISVTSTISMPGIFKPWRTAWASATKPPVIAAVRVPPSAWITSQSTLICTSPSNFKSTTARRLRPIRR